MFDGGISRYRGEATVVKEQMTMAVSVCIPDVYEQHISSLSDTAEVDALESHHPKARPSPKGLCECDVTGKTGRERE